MYRVVKRDNKIVDFDISKIKNAMSLAFEAQEIPCHPDVLDLLALKVTADFASKVKKHIARRRSSGQTADSVCMLIPVKLQRSILTRTL